MKDPFAISRMTAANAALQGWRLSVENIRNGGSQEDRIDLHGNLAHAQLAQADAAKALTAIQQLQQKGAASEAEVDAAEQRLKSADATLETLKEKSTEPYTARRFAETRRRMWPTRRRMWIPPKVQFNNANIVSPMAGNGVFDQCGALRLGSGGRRPDTRGGPQPCPDSRLLRRARDRQTAQPASR